MPVAITESGMPYYSAGFPVRFYRSDGTDWVGNFAPGWTKFNAVYELYNTNHLLVIAGGSCYIMDPDKESPVDTYGPDYYGAVQLPDGRTVLHSNLYLTIVGPDGSIWHTERISWDGIKDVCVHENIISGLALAINSPNYDEEWVEFSYNLDSRELIGKAYN